MIKMDNAELQKRIEQLEDLIYSLIKFDRLILNRDIQMQTGRNFIFAKSDIEGTGTKFGTEPTQKLSFWGVDPVGQQLYFAFPSIASVSGSGADATINANFSHINSAFDDIDQILTNVGITSIRP
jgi:hypothetical protein